MALERNGVIILEEHDAADPDNAANKAVRDVNLGDVRFPFGFFIKQDGKGKKFVEPATFQDKLKILRMVNPDFPDDPDPIFTGSCHSEDDGRVCRGGCGKLSVGFRCLKITHPPSSFFGCGCIDIS